MPRHIKTAALAGQQEEADAKVRGTVEAIIADVQKRGDAAVRELSERFDKWSPASFRLSGDEIRALVQGYRRRQSTTSSSRSSRSATLPKSSGNR
jgi:sulfopropanediol 3-dehydrogenase